MQIYQGSDLGKGHEKYQQTKAVITTSLSSLKLFHILNTIEIEINPQLVVPGFYMAINIQPHPGC